MDTDFENREELLKKLYTQIDRSNEVLYNETKELLNFANGGLFSGTYESNRSRVKLLCDSCKTLMETQTLLVKLLESTLLTMNLQLNFSKEYDIE